MNQGVYKTIEYRTTEIFLKFPLFYLANEEIQSCKIQNDMVYNFEFSRTVFPRTSQDKRAGTLNYFCRSLPGRERLPCFSIYPGINNYKLTISF